WVLSKRLNRVLTYSPTASFHSRKTDNGVAIIATVHLHLH
ncbi:hypothetical protein JMJ77_0009813, partial [Colletotrichum scovillei]